MSCQVFLQIVPLNSPYTATEWVKASGGMSLQRRSGVNDPRELSLLHGQKKSQILPQQTEMTLCLISFV